MKKMYYVEGMTIDNVEIEEEFEDFDDARCLAGTTIEEGGWAILTDNEGNMYDPFAYEEESKMTNKVYDLAMILEDGSLYGETAVETMTRSPEDRAKLVEFWLNKAITANEDWERYEAVCHAAVAFVAKENMGNKTVTEPLPEFFKRSKNWYDWMKEQIDG